MLVKAVQPGSSVSPAKPYANEADDEITRGARCLATAVSQADPAGPSKPRRFPKLDDGLTFGDFASGAEIPRVVLGNTSQ
jgi:hypothetical protein